MKRVLKWTVRVDDHDHPIGSGPVVMVLASPEATRVNVWTVEEDESAVHPARPLRPARAYATGQPVPLNETYLGSTRHEPSGLVWHVFGGEPR